MSPDFTPCPLHLILFKSGQTPLFTRNCPLMLFLERLNATPELAKHCSVNLYDTNHNPYDPGFPGILLLKSKPFSYRSLRSLSPGATPADAMTRPGVLSLSPHMTFSIRPQKDKEIPPTRAAQALLTLPPPRQGYLYQLIHESPTAGLLQLILPLSSSPADAVVRLPYPSTSRTHDRR